MIDPVCGMAVHVATAEASGLSVEWDGRTYVFCRPGCRRAFLEDPQTYSALAEVAADTATAPATHGTAVTLPIIDEGMRRWYESCSCCLGDAYPEIKAQLDAERAAAARPPWIRASARWPTRTGDAPERPRKPAPIEHRYSEPSLRGPGAFPAHATHPSGSGQYPAVELARDGHSVATPRLGRAHIGPISTAGTCSASGSAAKNSRLEKPIRPAIRAAWNVAMAVS